MEDNHDLIVLLMSSKSLCRQCNREFCDLEAELHPTEDGAICPYCGATVLYTETIPMGWEADLEVHFDREWERGE